MERSTAVIRAPFFASVRERWPSPQARSQMCLFWMSPSRSSMVLDVEAEVGEGIL